MNQYTATPFWSLVDKTETCWLWLGGKETRGYGYAYRARKRLRAHRIAYEELVGPIPEGMELDHLCRVLACVNPDHLEPVTHAENVRRGVGPTAVNARKLTCPRGHPLPPPRPAGGRNCRACRRRSPDAPVATTCLRCSGPIPKWSKSTRVYCSDRCRGRASDARRRAPFPLPLAGWNPGNREGIG